MYYYLFIYLHYYYSTGYVTYYKRGFNYRCGGLSSGNTGIRFGRCDDGGGVVLAYKSG